MPPVYANVFQSTVSMRNPPPPGALPVIGSTYVLHDWVIYSVILTSIFRRMGSKFDPYCALITVVPFS